MKEKKSHKNKGGEGTTSKLAKEKNKVHQAGVRSIKEVSRKKSKEKAEQKKKKLHLVRG